MNESHHAYLSLALNEGVADALVVNLELEDTVDVWSLEEGVKLAVVVLRQQMKMIQSKRKTKGQKKVMGTWRIHCKFL